MVVEVRNNITYADLVACARRVGVTVVEAPSSHRGKKGKMGTVRGVTLHHTGTPNNLRPTSDYPDFQVVKEGRAGLVNSLSAYGIGRRDAIYVFSEFLSWHAGTWNWKGLTDGNGGFLGIEAAGVGDWTQFQLKVYPRLVASVLLFINEGTDMAPRHMDGAMPRGRKTDAARLPSTFYGDVKWLMANPDYINVNYVESTTEPEEEDDMPNSLIRNTVTGEMVVAAPGFWQRIPGPAYIGLYIAAGYLKDDKITMEVDQEQFDHLRVFATSMERNDEETLEKLRELSAAQAAQVTAAAK